jgi:hypothetical protein
MRPPNREGRPSADCSRAAARVGGSGAVRGEADRSPGWLLRLHGVQQARYTALFAFFWPSQGDVATEYPHGVETECVAEVDELANINAPFSSFHLRNESLSVTKPTGERTLSNACRSSRVLEQLKQNLIVGLVSRARHMLASDWPCTLESDFE